MCIFLLPHNSIFNIWGSYHVPLFIYLGTAIIFPGLLFLTPSTVFHMPLNLSPPVAELARCLPILFPLIGYRNIPFPNLPRCKVGVMALGSGQENKGKMYTCHFYIRSNVLWEPPFSLSLIGLFNTEDPVEDFKDMQMPETEAWIPESLHRSLPVKHLPDCDKSGKQIFIVLSL